MFKTKVLLLIAASMMFMGFVKSDDDVYLKMARSIDIFGRIYKEINLQYVDKIDPEEFMISGIKGMLSSLDPYTNYVDESMQKDMEVITKGKYGGIGASVGLRESKVTIVDLIEGYSAERQGIRIGDVITRIDSIELDPDNYTELSSFLKGDPGTLVRVEVERDGYDEPIIFNLVREMVEIKNLTYYGFYPENSANAYLKLSGFSRTAGEEVKSAIAELKQQKELESVIIDLRGNPGGLLDAAIDVSEKFLDKDNLVVSVVSRDTTQIARYFSKENPIAGDLPMAVMINNASASASEIVAGAIQDHDRGIIVGNTSFGKGLVQTIVPLTLGTSLKLTTAKYFTPSGRSIQRIDYADHNKVFDEVTKPISVAEYKTDNKRVVYSGGGVKPDTIVSNFSGSKQIEVLIARGMFFKFATNYFNQHENMDWAKINKDEIVDSFIEFVGEEEFNYTCKAEKLLGDLKETAESESYSPEYMKLVNGLIAETEKIKNQELRKYKDVLLVELGKEFLAREDGRKGRIEQSLENDAQLDVAVNLLKNKEQYNKLLNIGN